MAQYQMSSKVLRNWHLLTPAQKRTVTETCTIVGTLRENNEESCSHNILGE